MLCTVAAGAGSCLGLLAAPARVDRSVSRVQLLVDVDWKKLAASLERMRQSAETELGQAVAGAARWTLGAEIRYAGQGNAVDIGLPYRPRKENLATRVLKKRSSVDTSNSTAARAIGETGGRHLAIDRTNTHSSAPVSSR